MIQPSYIPGDVSLLPVLLGGCELAVHRNESGWPGMLVPVSSDFYMVLERALSGIECVTMSKSLGFSFRISGISLIFIEAASSTSHDDQIAESKTRPREPSSRSQHRQLVLLLHRKLLQAR